MKHRKLYKQNFEDPIKRFSRYWKVSEGYVQWIALRFLRDAWTIREVREHTIDFTKYNITKRNLERFIEALKKYQKVRDAKLKSGAVVSQIFFRNQP